MIKSILIDNISAHVFESKWVPHLGAAQVFVVNFWMMLHGARSPKRTMFMGNMSTMGILDKGKLTKKEREKRTGLKTTRSMAACSFVYLDGVE